LEAEDKAEREYDPHSPPHVVDDDVVEIIPYASLVGSRGAVVSATRADEEEDIVMEDAPAVCNLNVDPTQLPVYGPPTRPAGFVDPPEEDEMMRLVPDSDGRPGTFFPLWAFQYGPEPRPDDYEDPPEPVEYGCAPRPAGYISPIEDVEYGCAPRPAGYVSPPDDDQPSRSRRATTRPATHGRGHRTR
jgi:hypothetical protein